MSESRLKLRSVAAVAVAFVLLNLCPAASAQRRQQRTRTQPTIRRAPPARRAPAAAAPATAAGADARMTGVYLINPDQSADPRAIAERAAAHLPPDERERVLDELAARLSSPGQIAIRRRGRTIDLASTRAPLVSFVADGVTHTERAGDGRVLRSRAAVYGDSLMISSTGDANDEFSVNLDAIDGGRRLRVTRRVTDPRIGRPIVVQSVYEKTSQAARFTVYGEPVPAPVSVARNTPQQPAHTTTGRVPPRPLPQQQQQPPVLRTSEPARLPTPAPADDAAAADPFGGFHIDDDARFVTVLNNDLSTNTAREGDPFTLTVRSPDGFEGATIEGRVVRVERGGRVSGRAELQLEVERIRLADGRTQDITGFIEEVRPTEGGEDVRVDNESEGRIGERDSPSKRTTQRVAIGAAVGAIIGAIAGGGKGAGIGAVIGAGAGAGSVYAQGRDHLELQRGSEVVLSLRPRQPQE